MSYIARHGSVIAVCFATGCAAHSPAPTTDDTTALAQDGSDASAAENDTETLSTSFIGSSGGTLGLASAGNLAGGRLQLDNFGDAVKAAYSPAGCVSATNDVATHTATYVFSGCTGPYGLRTVTGTVKVTYSSPSPTVLVLDVAASQLHVSRATVDWSAHAEITARPLGERVMTWAGQLSGTTARGREFTRSNAKTVKWTVGQDCVKVDGHSDGRIGARNVHTDVANYSRCKGECPAAGSTIRITNSDTGRSVQIAYDGGNQATFTGPNGGQVQITLACGL